LTQWRESGLTASAFARVKGMANRQRLNWWRKRLEKADTVELAPLTFIPAQVTGATHAATVVRLPGDEGLSNEVRGVLGRDPLLCVATRNVAGAAASYVITGSRRWKSSDPRHISE
jgi:hypothetical protein